MADNKKEVGKPDRDRVSAEEKYEVDVLVKKSGKSREAVIAAINKHGPMRKNVEKALGISKTLLG
jgi:hypothetical protein